MLELQRVLHAALRSVRNEVHIARCVNITLPLCICHAQHRKPQLANQSTTARIEQRSPEGEALALGQLDCLRVVVHNLRDGRG